MINMLVVAACAQVKVSRMPDGNQTGLCHYLAAHSTAMLQALGNNAAQFAAGYAGWRVNGELRHGTVLHHPMAGIKIGEDGAEDFHAWVQIGNYVFDPTTIYLRQASAELDEACGQYTPVEWSPDYFYGVPDSKEPDYMIRSARAGANFYRRVLRVEQQLCPTAGLIEDQKTLVGQYHKIVKLLEESRT